MKLRYVMKKASALIACSALILSGCANKGGTASGNTSATTYVAGSGNVGDVSINKGDTYAVLTVKGFGDIKMKLFPDIAPVAVAEITKLSESGYYKGKIMHRIINDFMIQGGSFDGSGYSGPDDPNFAIEPSINARHFYGALCMANAGGINGSQFYIVNSKNTNAFEEQYAQIAQYEGQVELIDGMLKETGDSGARADGLKTQKAALLTMIANLKDAPAEIRAKYAAVGGVPFLDGDYTVWGQTVEGFDVIDKISAVEVGYSMGGEMSVPAQTVEIVDFVIKIAE